MLSSRIDMGLSEVGPTSRRVHPNRGGADDEPEQVYGKRNWLPRHEEFCFP